MNNTNNIHDNDDPQGLNPRFKKGAKNPFKAEAGYFENFAEKIQSRVNTFEEIKNEAPVLSNIPKYNPFDVPAGYFDELPTLVQQRCINEKTKTPLIEWLLFLIKPRFAVPVLTVLIIAFAGIYYVNTGSITDPANNTMAEEISIDEELQNIDETIIMEALTAEAITETAADTEDDRIVDYLMDNNIDEASLSIEL